MPIRGRLRNSGGDPGTQGPAGNRGSRRVCGASGRVGSGQQPGNRQLSDRRAGLCDRARPLHLIHGGASSLCRHLLWRIRALAASACTPTASRRGAAPPGLRSERRRSERRGKAVPQGRPGGEPGRYSEPEGPVKGGRGGEWGPGGEPGKYSLWIAMWMSKWTGAGKQGITPSCPVDSQRILRLSAQSPCASQRPGSRNSLTTERGSGGDPGTVGIRETGNRAVAGPVVAGQQGPRRATGGRAIGGL